VINSELQFVACEIAEFVGEPKKVGFWIGIVKRIGKSRAYEIMSQIKDYDRRKAWLLFIAFVGPLGCTLSDQKRPNAKAGEFRTVVA
jgi:hypothetical protein